MQKQLVTTYQTSIWIPPHLHVLLYKNQCTVSLRTFLKKKDFLSKQTLKCSTTSHVNEPCKNGTMGNLANLTWLLVSAGARGEKRKKKKSNVRTKAAHRDQSVDPELVCHPKEWYPGACRALNVDVFQLGRSSIAPTCLPSRNFAYFASLCSNWTGYTGVKKNFFF